MQSLAQEDSIGANGLKQNGQNGRSQISNADIVMCGKKLFLSLLQTLSFVGLYSVGNMKELMAVISLTVVTFCGIELIMGTCVVHKGAASRL